MLTWEACFFFSPLDSTAYWIRRKKNWGENNGDIYVLVASIIQYTCATVNPYLLFHYGMEDAIHKGIEVEEGEKWRIWESKHALKEALMVFCEGRKLPAILVSASCSTSLIIGVDGDIFVVLIGHWVEFRMRGEWILSLRLRI